jgi:hypothetical protein
MLKPTTNPLKQTLIEFGKKVAFKYTNLGAPTYPYSIEPIQLATLITEIERLADVRGAILEIGVARGMTTRFLAEHIASSDRRERLIVIDTFSSFVDSDFEYEMKHRGKRRSEICGYGYNDYDVWVKNFRRYSFVEVIRSDCAGVNYQVLSPIKVALLDVDLYLPTKKTLPLLFDALAPGGSILVDDVKEDYVYAGAYDAYMEFCAERGIAPQVIGTKCGILRK